MISSSFAVILSSTAYLSLPSPTSILPNVKETTASLKEKGYITKELEEVKLDIEGEKESLFDKIKNLSTGCPMVFGTAFKLPLLVKFDLPNPMPKSSSLDIKNVWYN